VVRGWSPMPLHEFLGEAFARLQLRRRLGWSEDRPSAALELVHHAQSQGQFGADDGDIGIQPAGQFDNPIEALEIDGSALGVGGYPAAAGRAVQLLDARRLPQLPRNCVFATTTAEDEYLHRESFTRCLFNRFNTTVRKERVGLWRMACQTING